MSIAVTKKNIKNMYIRVLPPDINESRVEFAVTDGNIRFGLLAIRNVGRQFLEQILDERRRGKLLCERGSGLYT